VSGLTINEAAATTGWSPRMLRYVEQLGLVDAPRSGGGYRLYGPVELQRLRSLRELLERHGATLAEVAFAARLQQEPELAADLAGWFESAADTAAAPTEISAPPARADADWLAFEQAKHQQLLHR
jgi:DNA-binding transcriptional MerR regulator